MFVMPGPPSRRKIGSARVIRLAWIRVTGRAIRRDSRIGSVLGNDERAAVGLEATVLGGVGTAVEYQVAGVRALRHGNPVGAREAEVGEAEHGQRDEHEGDNSCSREGALSVIRTVHRCSFQRRPRAGRPGV